MISEPFVVQTTLIKKNNFQKGTKTEIEQKGLCYNRYTNTDKNINNKKKRNLNLTLRICDICVNLLVHSNDDDQCASIQENKGTTCYYIMVPRI
uniref:Uncharacterized protein n=1 Tax=Romanomermis culicivorax TaxID=13658 RepID=A0A915HVW5_ROMCU